MCYADFCDVFRCSGYLRSHRRRRKLKNRDKAFTKILGKQEALYDLGINIHGEDFWDFDPDEENPVNNPEIRNALVKAPPQHVLRVLDEHRNSGKSRDKFVVGIGPDQETLGKKKSGQPDSQMIVQFSGFVQIFLDFFGFDNHRNFRIVEDPYGIGRQNSGEYGDETGSKTGTRPRGGGNSEYSKTGKSGLSGKSQLMSKVRAKFESKRRTFSDELDEIVNKAAILLEKKFGKKIPDWLQKNKTEYDEQEQQSEEEEVCDPDDMKLVQDRCTVRISFHDFLCGIHKGILLCL